MDYATWAPVYESILDEFEFEQAADERARDVLAELAEPFDHGRLDLSGKTVAIAGAGPSLAGDRQRATAADAVVAASTAADTLLAHGIDVDCMVTDLDKTPETASDLTHRGVPVAAHAHGDNIPAVREHVPTFEGSATIPTTQAEPVGPVENFGGFTDGDRAAFLADAFGAEALLFVGWDFDDPDVGAMKARKLEWAERLLYWLEQRRGESFDVLDGRRDAIDTSALPSQS